MKNLNKIQNISCLELLQQLETNSIDLLITDPPYGMNIHKLGFIKDGGNKRKFDKATSGKKTKDIPKTKYADNLVQWDTRPTQEEFNEMQRVSKKLIVFGGNYFTDLLPQSSNWLVWDKRVRENYKNDFSDCELVWTNLTGNKTTKYNCISMGCIQDNMKDKEKRYHPTQKPIKLLRDIISDNTTEGDIVCDPYGGSFSTAVTCEQLGLPWISGDINSAYCDIGNERISEEKAKGKKLSNWFTPVENQVGEL